MQPAPPPPEKPSSFKWPVLVNLALLVWAAISTHGESGLMAIAVGVLTATNVLAALVALVIGWRHWVAAFILSGILVVLIGLGACFMMLKNMHVNGN